MLRPSLVLIALMLPVAGAGPVMAQTLPATTAPASLLQSAESRFELGEFEDARAAIEQAIEQLTVAEDPNNELLIEAWSRLGAAYAAEGLIPLALDSLESAGDLSRRHFGLFNDKLVEILYQMEETARASGDFETAAGFRDEAARVIRQIWYEGVRETRKTFGTGSLEHLNATIGYAGWLADYDEYQSRKVYNEALDLIRDHFDDNRQLQARVFQAIGTDIGEYFEFGNATHEPYELIRARRIIERTSDADPILHASILRDIGDSRLTSGSRQLQRRAARAYREAWQILENVEGGETFQEQLFGEPELIRPGFAPLSSVRNISYSPDAPEGLVDLEFSVNEDGRVRDVTVLSANPAWMRDDAVRQLRFSVFRPRIENGELVAGEGQYSFSFRYMETLARNLE